MLKFEKKPVIGMLGGIASGKSIVAGLFADRGCAVIDADEMVHEMFLFDVVKDEIRAVFGNGAFDSEMEIDRKALGEMTFDDPEKLKRLNSILHPRVISRTEELIDEYRLCDDIKAIVLDVPLLVEIGWESRCDILVYVELDEEIRLKRALKRSFNSEEQLKKREKFQISLDKKRELAHYIVNNNSDISATSKQVTEILNEILGDDC